VTGTLSAGATTTGALVVQGAASVTGTLSAGAATTGPLQVNGAINGTSTLIVTSGITAASLSATGTVRAGNNLNVANTITGTDLALTGTLGFSGVMQAGGTAFPSSPANNDLFYRTDLDMEFFYDGTRWLSVNLFRCDLTAGSNETATFGQYGMVLDDNLGGTDLWLVEYGLSAFVSSGASALSASHKWVGVLAKVDSANADTAVATINIDSGASGAWRSFGGTIGALRGTTFFVLRVTWTKTGTPGNLYSPFYITYRIVAT
jgi:hypothetical protein